VKGTDTSILLNRFPEQRSATVEAAALVGPCAIGT
jgi:hypothetical protein